MPGIRDEKCRSQNRRCLRRVGHRRGSAEQQNGAERIDEARERDAPGLINGRGRGCRHQVVVPDSPAEEGQ